MEQLSIKRHIVFLGASGSGKTELSVNFAVSAAKLAERRVSFFDMDQTKGLFRSRDLFDELACRGIEPAECYNFQDAPVVPAGVVQKLRDPAYTCVFDVGGNSAGAIMIGQYTYCMPPEDTDYFYVINPCRPLTDTAREVEQSMVDILTASRVHPNWVKIISNPNMGRETDPALILKQHGRLCQLLSQLDMAPSFLSAERTLAAEVTHMTDLPVIPLELYLRRFY